MKIKRPTECSAVILDLLLAALTLGLETRPLLRRARRALDAEHVEADVLVGAVGDLADGAVGLEDLVEAGDAALVVALLVAGVGEAGVLVEDRVGEGVRGGVILRGLRGENGKNMVLTPPFFYQYYFF